jgi:hypothetical protein
MYMTAGVVLEGAIMKAAAWKFSVSSFSNPEDLISPDGSR